MPILNVDVYNKCDFIKVANMYEIKYLIQLTSLLLTHGNFRECQIVALCCTIPERFLSVDMKYLLNEF